MMFKFKDIDITKLPVKNLIIICLAIVCLTSVRECSNKSLEVENNEGNWKFKYAMMVDSFKVETNKFGEQLAYQEQLTINEKQAKEYLKNENSQLKKIKSSTKVKTITKIKEVYIPFSETVSSTEFSDAREIDTVKSFNLNTEWYSIDGKVYTNGLVLDSLLFKNELTTTVGWKKDKWYKKKYAIVEVKNSNPHTSITGMQNITVKPPKKKFFQTTAFKVGAGAVGALWLRSKL